MKRASSAAILSPLFNIDRPSVIESIVMEIKHASQPNTARDNKATSSEIPTSTDTASIPQDAKHPD